MTHASDIILMIDTGATYLVIPAARSCIEGHYYVTNRMPNYSKGCPTPNRPTLTECKTLKNSFSSSAEVEIGGTFKNAQNLIPLRHILETVSLDQKPIK